MYTTDRECERLDTEFLTNLSDWEMQHFWTNLPHRADRNRCVMWITKFREPQEGLHAKRNRNEYMQLMKRMLRKGIVEAPFNHTPQPGLLPVLPAFMFAHYNDYNSTFDVHNQGETEIEQRIFEVIARCKQEKLNMRKEQEHNMEKHMNETNQKLCEIEEKYNKKIEATSALICGLEDRVQQLMADADSSTRQRYDLEKQRAELESRVERLQADFQDIQAKHAVLEKENKNLTGDHEQEVRAVKNKHEANVEFFKQELNLHSVRAANNMSELEQHLSKLKQALDTADLDRQKSLREVEENKHKDIAHLKQLHSNKVRSLQTIHENLQDESKRKILKLEETIKEKDNNMARMQKQHEEHNQQAEKDIEEFKQQVHANSTKMHMDMKQQMDKASQDLNHSKQLREKQAKELQKQVETEKQTHQQKLREVSQKYEETKKALDRLKCRKKESS